MNDDILRVLSLTLLFWTLFNFNRFPELDKTQNKTCPDSWSTVNFNYNNNPRPNCVNQQCNANVSNVNWWTYVIIRILDQFESGVRHVCIFTHWQQLETGLSRHVSCPRHLKLTWIFSSKYGYKYSKSVGKCWCCAM